MKGKVASFFQAFGRFVQLLALSVVGGVLNRARGGWLSLSNMTYAEQHIVPRMLVGLTAGALIALLSRNSTLGIVVGFSMWASIYVGWGSYMAVGYNPNDYTSRAGYLDWIIGRDMEGYDFTQRWVREFPGMSLRGLMWTGPGGYIVYHLGYGWQYALSGAAMGLIYNLGVKSPSTLENFSSGTEMGEFLFGMWLWLSLISTALARYKFVKLHAFFSPRHIADYEFSGSTSADRQPTYAKFERHLERGFEVLMCFFNAILLGSCIFYVQVHQADKNDKAQTLFGLCFCWLLLAVSQFVVFRRSRRQGVHVDERVPLINSDDNFGQAPSSGYVRAIMHWLWPVGGVSPYIQVRTLIGWVGLGCTLLSIVLMFVALFWNLHTPRFNNDDD